MNRISVGFENNSYDICITRGFEELSVEVQRLKAGKILIISDSNVSGLYLKNVREVLCKVCSDVHTVSFEAGEQSKHIGTVQNLYDACIQNGLDRKSLIVALGGGIVGDIAGFVSATYMRGIRYVQVPTTLLAQTDSSVGGKVGFDFNGCKNIVGAFKQPSLVYVNTDTLFTLPEREFSAGMGEVIKYGFIRDVSFLEYLKNNAEQIKLKDPECLSDIIERCCRIKAAVVQADEKEDNLRAILNFGHSVGHAIESAKNFTLLHGECVALGMRTAIFIALKRGYVTENDSALLDELLSLYDLPIATDALNVGELFEYLSKDKKSVNGVLKFVLPQPSGNAVICEDITPEELSDGMKVVFINE